MQREQTQAAQHYEGSIPDTWELLEMRENRSYIFRYYKTPSGEIRFTTQKRKRKQEGHFELRKDEKGRTYAKKTYQRRRCIY